MKSILWFLILLPSLVFAGQGMGPGPGVKGYASVVGGTLIVGDEAIAVTDQTGSSTDANDFIGKSFSASGSGTIASCYMRLRGEGGSEQVKFVIADGSSGAIIATSEAVSLTTVYSDVSFTVSGSVTASSLYKIGVIPNGSIYVATLGTWEGIVTSNSFTSPTTVTGANGDSAIGSLKVWCDN